MKKRSANQIKNLIIALIVLVVLAVVFLIVFLANVNVNKTTENTVASESEETEGVTEEYYTVNAENMDNSVNNVDVQYYIEKADANGIFKFTLKDNKLSFVINDEEKFADRYSNTELDLNDETEVALHDYKIVDFAVGNVGDALYLVVVTDSGYASVMNVDEAVERNVFRIKNELISLKSSIMQVQCAVKVVDSVESESIVLVAADRVCYDLESLIE